MALINRITRLFQADMHAVLDRLEEPDSLLRQAVREMEEEIAADEQRLKLWQHEKTLIVERQGELAQSINRIDEELDLCFNSKQETLARNLVKRKLETRKFGKFLTRKAESLDSSLTDLTQRLNENHGRLQSMQQKLELLNQETLNSRSEDNWLAPETNVQDDEVEVAFLQEQQARTSS